MISIKTNIGEVAGRLSAKFKTLLKGSEGYDKAQRAACFALAGDIRQRIHVDGKDANGSPIGSYSDSYMKIRKLNNRLEPQDKKVLSLTRQLESGFTVVVNPSGQYGVGWLGNEPVKKYVAGIRKTKSGGAANILRDSLGNGEKYKFIKDKYPNVYKPSESEKIRAKEAWDQFINQVFQ